jgi:bifunctional enzyme CysN/CysC
MHGIAPKRGDRATTVECGLLRILTCGSVDDGKSTLIGRLLHDLGAISDDQMRTLQAESKRSGSVPDGLDLALLLDGLESEQEQGITIDVAYRQVRTPQIALLIADAPGHEQYTRNMATGASVSDLAVVLVDARKGVLTQTRRHTLIASHFGIRHVVVAVNKCDLVNYDERIFRHIVDDYNSFASGLKFRTVAAVPVSALRGVNVVNRSRATAWHEGPTLWELLTTIDVRGERSAASFRMPVQWVCRPDAEFRGFAGTVTSGSIAVGDDVIEASRRRGAKVARIVTSDGDRQSAEAGDAVMLTLAEEIDLSRGDVLCSGAILPDSADQFAAHLLWLDDKEMLPGRSYWMKIGTRTVPASITALKHRIDVDTGLHIAAKTLASNEIAFCNLALALPLPIDQFVEHPDTGCFILIDRETNTTAAAGTISFGLRRAANIHPHHFDVDKHARAKAKRQRSAVLWFTGLSGAGKSTIANLVEQKLHGGGFHTYLIDGDNIRRGLNRDLGFTEADRVENVRRVAEVARLMVDAGLIVIVALISPFRSERQLARERVDQNEFVEIYVDAPLDVCRRRDPKGLYAKAAAGQLVNFTGVDSPYEVPASPDLHLQTAVSGPEELSEQVVSHLHRIGILDH